jgi:hypothetical protein
MEKNTSKKLVFVAIFIALTLIGKNLNFSSLVGAENQSFTMFQFFGPVAGSFLGPILGVISVLGAQLIDFLVAGKIFTLVNIIRLSPMLFAAYYFGTKKKHLSLIIPILAMAAFILHPVGRQVWFFSLYWTIPVIAKLLPKRYSENILAKSLGATFTAHAVGSAAWIWSVPMTPEQWILLIPIVAFERLLFAAGISGSYVCLNTVLDYVTERFSLKLPFLNINKDYVLTKPLYKAA